jgi:outer membrane protein assembly factor BamA
VLRCVVVILLAWCVACGGTTKKLKPHVAGNEYLKELKLVNLGPSIIDPSDIVPRLGLKAIADAQRSIDEYQLQLDTQRVIGAYQRVGYLGVDVKTKIDKAPNEDAATLTFEVTPGKRATSHLEFFGLPEGVDYKKVLDAVGVKENALFDYDAYDAAKEPLDELMQDSGYAHVRIESTVIADRTKARATLRWVIDPGPLAKFGAVELVGVEEGLANSVRERITFVTGQRYSHQAIADTQQAIYSAGLFGSVRVESASDSIDAIVPIKIVVTPVTKNELSAGGGFGLDPASYNARLRFTWTRRGVVTPLTTSSLDLRPEYAFEQATCGNVFDPFSCKSDFRGRVVETLSQQDLFMKDLRGEAEAGADYLVYEAYAKLGTHVRLGLSQPITKWLQVRVGWLYQINDFPETYVRQDVAAKLGIDNVNYIGAYSGSLILDLRNNPINPTYGIYAEARAVRGTKYALGNYEYLQLTPEFRGYLAVAPEYVLAGRIRFGTISGQVPASERYFEGGTSSHRGFGGRQLSPFGPSAPASGCPFEDNRTTPQCVPTQLPIGGAGLFEASLELRGPVFHIKGLPLDDVLFLDGGDVTFTASEIDPTNLHWALGLGLRIATALGPIGLDVAYRINRQDDDGLNPNPGTTTWQRLKFLFAVGEAF